MVPFQRLVVGVVAEAVEECPDLNALAAFLAEQVEEQKGYGVVAEVEVLQMDAFPGLPDGLEHIVELLLPAHQQVNIITLGKLPAVCLHLLTEYLVAGLCLTALQQQERNRQEQ